jgi:hypothetical protein
LILIASGAGITPAISVVDQYHSQRKVFLIFVTNDISMVKFFSRKLGKVKSYVFFTGKDPEFGELVDFFRNKFQKADELLDDDTGRPVYGHDEEMGLISSQKLATVPTIPETIPETRTISAEGIESKEPETQRYDRANLHHQATNSFIHRNFTGDTVNLMKGRPNIQHELKMITDTGEQERRFMMGRRKSWIDSSFLRKRELDEPTMQMEGSLTDWAVMYCGASKPLHESIEEACDNMKIRYTSEYFDNW